jgi:hypothetical protein
MIKKLKSKFGYLITAVALTGFAAGVAWADQQSISFTKKSGGSGGGCPGTYTGYAKMTNSAGTFSITPPTNVVSGTLTDASGFPSPYVSVANVSCSDFSSWCDTNSVTFPATHSKTYTLTVYVKSPTPPPTNGQPMNLQITWQ